MIQHSEIPKDDLRAKIKRQEIRFGGNKNLKIYGVLSCVSGKRMKRENRVFFSTENEAIENGFRSCAHCMTFEYKKWKNELI